MYKLLYNEYPYSLKELLSLTDNLKFPDTNKISQNLNDLLTHMIKKDQKSRIDLDGILTHPFLNVRIEGKVEKTFFDSNIILVKENEYRIAINSYLKYENIHISLANNQNTKEEL